MKGIDFLTEPRGRIALSSALVWHPTNELCQEHEANKANSSTPFELSRVPHSRFGSCAQDPVADIKPAEDEFEDDDNPVILYEEIVVHNKDADLDSNATEDGSMDEDDLEMKHEDAKDYEPYAGFGTHGDDANMYEREAIEPPSAVNLTDPEPLQTCGHGREYREHCSSCVALCDYRERLANKALVLQNQQTLPVKEETAPTDGKKKRRQVRNIALVKRVPTLTEVKTQAN